MIFHHLLVMLGNMVKFFIVYQSSHGRSVAVIQYNNFPEFTLLDVQSKKKQQINLCNPKKTTTDKSSEALTNFKDLQDLTDVYSLCNPDKHDFIYLHASDKSKIVK